MEILTLIIGIALGYFARDVFTQAKRIFNALAPLANPQNKVNHVISKENKTPLPKVW